jgi:Domain of unknown function DUF29
MTGTIVRYDDDFVAWAEQQSGALRAAARTGSNRLPDWENLAEEIEGLAISQRTALRSQIRRIVRHLVKLQFSPARDPRRGWIEAIGDARSEIEDLLEASPSLRTGVAGDLAVQTPRQSSWRCRISAPTAKSAMPVREPGTTSAIPKSRCWGTGFPRSRSV